MKAYLIEGLSKWFIIPAIDVNDARESARDLLPHRDSHLSIKEVGLSHACVCDWHGYMRFEREAACQNADTDLGRVTHIHQYFRDRLFRTSLANAKVEYWTGSEWSSVGMYGPLLESSPLMRRTAA